MSISTYSELQSEAASWLHRSDLTAEIKQFIRLAEADLQVRAKLSEWETSASVAVTSGDGTLPSDFIHAISATWGSGNLSLKPVSLERLNEYREVLDSQQEPTFYAIFGSTLKLDTAYSATVTLTYRARFTPLSDSATTNSLLTQFPDAYLQGTLYQASVWLRDPEGIALHKPLFEEAVERVRRYTYDRKYGSAPLQMRAA